MSTPAEERAVPRFGPGVRLNYDKVRERWGLLAPEKLFSLDAQAAEILAMVDGTRSVGAIIEALATRYTGAPRSRIADDVIHMLHGLADRNVVICE